MNGLSPDGVAATAINEEDRAVFVEWMGPALTAYRHRADLKEMLTGGLARLLGKAVSLAFTGMQGAGKTVLLDHLTGKAQGQDYKMPRQSQASWHAGRDGSACPGE